MEGNAQEQDSRSCSAERTKDLSGHQRVLGTLYGWLTHAKRLSFVLITDELGCGQSAVPALKPC